MRPARQPLLLLLQEMCDAVFKALHLGKARMPTFGLALPDLWTLVILRQRLEPRAEHPSARSARRKVVHLERRPYGNEMVRECGQSRNERLQERRKGRDERLQERRKVDGTVVIGPVIISASLGLS